MARNTQALVVFRHAVANRGLVGCVRDGQVRRVRLDPGPCPKGTYTVCATVPRSIRLNGEVAGYISERIVANPSEVVAYELTAVDLASGDVLNRVGELKRPVAETAIGGCVEDLVVTRDGSFAWIAAVDLGFEVRRSADGGPVMLASGMDIDPSSLKLRGRVLSWIQSGTRTTASLR